LFKIEGSAEEPGELQSWLDFTGTPVQFAPGTFALNGIVITEGDEYIIVVHSNDQKLFRIKISDKTVTQVDLGGTPQGGDGMALDGQVLYVLTRTQISNMVVRIQMTTDFSRGTVIDNFRDDSFAYPTTIAKLDSRMLVVNSQFDARNTGQAPKLPFTISDIPVPPVP
jgi:hypothetical protein